MTGNDMPTFTSVQISNNICWVCVHIYPKNFDVVQSLIEWGVGVENKSPGAQLRSLSTKEPCPGPYTPTQRETVPLFLPYSLAKHQRYTLCCSFTIDKYKRKASNKFDKAQHRMFPEAQMWGLGSAHTNTSKNTSLLSCVPCHAMRSTWLKLGVVRDLLSDKSGSQKGADGGRLCLSFCPVCRQSWGLHLVCHASWFKHHKMFELKKIPCFLRHSAIAAYCQ